MQCWLHTEGGQANSGTNSKAVLHCEFKRTENSDRMALDKGGLHLCHGEADVRFYGSLAISVLILQPNLYK